MAKLTLVMNLKNRAVYQYHSYPYNSMAVVKNDVYGVSPAGITQLQTGDDDNGTKIAMSADVLAGDLGKPNNKRILAFYLGGMTSGVFYIDSVFDKQTANLKTKTVEPRASSVPITMRTKGNRAQKGRYLVLTLRNKTGSYVFINNISGAFVNLPIGIVK